MAVRVPASFEAVLRARGLIEDKPTKAAQIPTPSNAATAGTPKSSLSGKYCALIGFGIGVFIGIVSLCQGNQQTPRKSPETPVQNLQWSNSSRLSGNGTYPIPAKTTAPERVSTGGGSSSYTTPTSYLQTTTPAIPRTDYSRYYDPTYKPAVGHHYVNGYFRKNGTYVQGHYRTNPDNSFYNNWSTKGNVNPYTGRVGTKRPPMSSYHRRR
jgi:hypothetical protein